MSWRALLLVVVTLERVGEKRSKCARQLRGREDSECANRQPGTSAAAAEHLPDPDLPCLLQLPVLACASLIEIPLPAEVFRSLRQPSPSHHTLSLELGYS